MLLSSLIIWGCEDHVLIHFQPECRVLHSNSPILSCFASFSTGVPSEIFITPCAILSIVPEVVCFLFHQVSSHLVKLISNSFHLQSECCPNYIILSPSLSYFNRSVVAIIPLLAGVSSKCFHCQVHIIASLFQPEYCRN